MVDIKVNASFILPGRILPAEPPCSKKGKRKKKKKKKENIKNPLEYVSEVIKLEKSQPLVINVRKALPARQTLHLNSDAYQFMTASDNPVEGYKIFEWKKLSPHKRLKIHLLAVAASLNAELESFTVLDD